MRVSRADVLLSDRETPWPLRRDFILRGRQLAIVSSLSCPLLSSPRSSSPMSATTTLTTSSSSLARRADTRYLRRIAFASSRNALSPDLELVASSRSLESLSLAIPLSRSLLLHPLTLPATFPISINAHFSRAPSYRGCRRHYACTRSLYRIDRNDLRANVGLVCMRVRVHVCECKIYIPRLYTPVTRPQVFVGDSRVYVLTLARVIGVYLMCTRERGHSSRARKTTRL